MTSQVNYYSLLYLYVLCERRCWAGELDWNGMEWPVLLFLVLVSLWCDQLCPDFFYLYL